MEEEEILDRLAFKEDWVKHALGVQPQNLALVTTIGDSMEPTLSPGDVVMLDTSINHIQSNSIYAIQVNGALLVKRVQKMIDGRVVIRSDNELYDPETINHEVAQGLSIIGRVVWAGRRF